MEIALAIGAISLILGGIVGVFDEINNEKQATEDKEYQDRKIEEDYKDDLDLYNMTFEAEKEEKQHQASLMVEDYKTMQKKLIYKKKGQILQKRILVMS